MTDLDIDGAGEHSYRNLFLEELESETQWEWKWEKLNRSACFWIDITSWFVRAGLLAVSSFQLRGGARHMWLLALATGLAAINLANPLLHSTFKWHPRHIVHDRKARAYSALKVEYLSGVKTLREAVEEFGRIRRESPEDQI